MNTFSIAEDKLAQRLARMARCDVMAYAQPEDYDAATVALLTLALEKLTPQPLENANEPISL
jgi:hypothetical protein